MEFIPARCPNCGGDLMLPKGKDDAICNYCGTKFLIKDSVNQTSPPPIDNLFSLAKAAQKAGNFAEAYSYYTRVLEASPENIEGWLGKAEAAGWQSTLARDRFSEMASGFDHALEIAPERDKDQLKRRISRVITSVASSYFHMANEHLDRFWKVGDSWNEFGQSAILLITLANKSLHLDPTNSAAIELKIAISKQVIQPVTGGKINQRLISNTRQEAGQLFVDFLNEAVEQMRAIDANYTPPK